MIRFLQPVAAILLLGAVGLATIALSVGDVPDRPASTSGVVQPAAPAATLAPEAVSSVARDLPLEAPVPHPSGILSYRLDGETIAVNVADPASPVALIEDLREPAVPHEAGTYPSPDGRYVASVRRDETGVTLEVSENAEHGELVFARALAGPDDPELVDATKSLAAAVEGVPLTIAWSPDSKHLAFGSLTGAPFSLAVARVDVWAALTREVEGGYVGELAWSPDSAHLAVSTYELGRRDHTVLMYDPGRATVRRISDGCAIVWAPDSTFIAVHREPAYDTGVWLLTPEGDTAIEVTSDELAFPLDWTWKTA